MVFKIIEHVVRVEDLENTASDLDSGSQLSNAWAELAIGMKAHDTVRINGKEHNKRQVCIRALGYDPNREMLWVELSSVLAPGEAVVLSRREFSRRECCVEALKRNNGCSPAWALLACAMQNSTDTTVVLGARYTQRACFEKAVECDPRCAMTWELVGAALEPGHSITFRDRHWSSFDCFVEALTYDDSRASAWFRLGSLLIGGGKTAVGDREVDAFGCFKRSVMLDRRSAMALVACGLAAPRSRTNAAWPIAPADGVDLSPRECFIEALRLDRTCHAAWRALGQCLWSGEFVLLKDHKIATQLDCMQQLVDLVPVSSDAWALLGIALATSKDEEETINVGGTDYTPRECFEQALSRDPNCHLAWNNLGATLWPWQQRHKVNGSFVDALKCFVRAVESIGPNGKYEPLPEPSSSVFNGGDHPQQQQQQLEQLQQQQQAPIATSPEEQPGVTRSATLTIEPSNNTFTGASGTWVASPLSPGRTSMAAAGVSTLGHLVANRPKPVARRDAALAWANLGACLGPDGETNVGDRKHVTARDCFDAALEFDERCAAAWFNLGTLVTEDHPYLLGGVRAVNAEGCFVRCLEADPACAVAWARLGLTLTNAALSLPSAAPSDGALTASIAAGDTGARPLVAASGSSAAVAIGSATTPTTPAPAGAAKGGAGEGDVSSPRRAGVSTTSQASGGGLSARRAARAAARTNNSNANAASGSTPMITLNGDALSSAVAADASASTSGLLRVYVAGFGDVTADDCFGYAEDFAPESVGTWQAMRAGSLSPNTRRQRPFHSHAGCPQPAPHGGGWQNHHPSSSRLKSSTSRTIAVTQSNGEYASPDQQQRTPLAAGQGRIRELVKQLEDRMCDGELWLRVAEECAGLKSHGRCHAWVRGVRMSPIDCLLAAVQVSPNSAPAWLALAKALQHTESGSMGEEFGQRSCLITALELDGQNGRAWAVLATCMQDQRWPTLTISGKRVTADDCIARAASLNPELQHDKEFSRLFDGYARRKRASVTAAPIVAGAAGGAGDAKVRNGDCCCVVC